MDADNWYRDGPPREAEDDQGDDNGTSLSYPYRMRQSLARQIAQHGVYPWLPSQRETSTTNATLAAVADAAALQQQQQQQQYSSLILADQLRRQELARLSLVGGEIASEDSEYDEEDQQQQGANAATAAALLGRSVGSSSLYGWNDARTALAMGSYAYPTTAAAAAAAAQYTAIHRAQAARRIEAAARAAKKKQVITIDDSDEAEQGEDSSPSTENRKRRNETEPGISTSDELKPSSSSAKRQRTQLPVRPKTERIESVGAPTKKREPQASSVASSVRPSNIPREVRHTSSSGSHNSRDAHATRRPSHESSSSSGSSRHHHSPIISSRPHRSRERQHATSSTSQSRSHADASRSKSQERRPSGSSPSSTHRQSSSRRTHPGLAGPFIRGCLASQYPQSQFNMQVHEVSSKIMYLASKTASSNPDGETMVEIGRTQLEQIASEVVTDRMKTVGRSVAKALEECQARHESILKRRQATKAGEASADGSESLERLKSEHTAKIQMLRSQHSEEVRQLKEKMSEDRRNHARSLNAYMKASVNSLRLMRDQSPYYRYGPRSNNE